MSEGWSLGWEKCIRGAGRAAVCAPAARGRGRENGEQRSGQRRETAERRGARAQGRERAQRERPHRRWYCTAEYCGRGGSRHFEALDVLWHGELFLCLATLLKKKMSERRDDRKPWTIVNTLWKRGGEISFNTSPWVQRTPYWKKSRYEDVWMRWISEKERESCWKSSSVNSQWSSPMYDEILY